MAVLERTLSFDHMWAATHPPAVKHTRLPQSLSGSGFAVKLARLDKREVPLLFDPRGRPFAEAGVFVGPLSDEPRLASYQRKARQTAEPAYAAAFERQFAYLKRANFNAELAWALHVADHPEIKGLVEALDPSGGSWVPPTFAFDVFRAVSEQSLLGLCSQRPTSADRLVVPRFVPGSNPAYATQLGISVVGETPNQTPSDVPLAQIDVSIGRLRTILRVSRDLFTDAP